MEERKNSVIKDNGEEKDFLTEVLGDNAIRREFFDHPMKISLFLLGVLIGQFAYLQKKRRNNAPILGKIKNLKLTSLREVRNLIVTVQDKLRAYDYLNARSQKLLEQIYWHYAMGEKTWNSNNDINFYLGFGIALCHAIWQRIPVPVEEKKGKDTKNNIDNADNNNATDTVNEESKGHEEKELIQKQLF